MEDVMISKEALGRRLRDTRCRQEMTLKDVEGRSGLSSTHISEIERGMTSPTIGALIRIAHALQKDPSYFIEERELQEFCITTEGDRPQDQIPSEIELDRAVIEPLTRGVLCGRLRSFLLRFEPGGAASLHAFHVGEDACFYCLEGRLEVRIDSFAALITPGDSLHGAITGVPAFRADEASPAQLLVIADPREESV
ncbi:MAG: helix-turn-helix domain-containing protein [Candidatus Eisenbacteria bacterium]|nr:helix-turn-helix domain-containing protein [Candidatus Latescibacterota bacterium]MBD3302061.1 helix-turn-helix domain-containing protein [Candidatus Eisenbacteria bacterium]